MKQWAMSELRVRFSGSAASSPQQGQRGSTRSGNRAISSWLTERVRAVRRPWLGRPDHGRQRHVGISCAAASLPAM